MKKKRRRYNTRLIRRDYSYSVQEICELFGLHKNAVLRWIKQGLKIIDTQKPYLAHGSDLKEFLDSRQQARKQSLKPHEFFCCKCRSPRAAWENIADLHILNNIKVKISGLCAICETRVHKLGTVKKIPQYEEIFKIQARLEQHISDGADPRVMCDMKEL